MHYFLALLTRLMAFASRAGKIILYKAMHSRCLSIQGHAFAMHRYPSMTLDKTIVRAKTARLTPAFQLSIDFPFSAAKRWRQLYVI